MPDMQKDLHPELEQSDKGGVSEMPEKQEEGKAREASEAQKVARESALAVGACLDYSTGVQFDTIMLSLHPTIPGGFPWESLRDDRPHNSLEAGGDGREESPRNAELNESVRTMPRDEKESREPSDERQADRSDKGTGKAGNVDGEDKESV